jgi:hypothetical protein
LAAGMQMHLWSDIKEVYFNSEYVMVIFITPVILLNSLGFAYLVQETYMHFANIIITSIKHSSLK